MISVSPSLPQAGNSVEAARLSSTNKRRRNLRTVIVGDSRIKVEAEIAPLIKSLLMLQIPMASAELSREFEWVEIVFAEHDDVLVFKNAITSRIHNKAADPLYRRLLGTRGGLDESSPDGWHYCSYWEDPSLGLTSLEESRVNGAEPLGERFAVGFPARDIDVITAYLEDLLQSRRQELVEGRYGSTRS